MSRNIPQTSSLRPIELEAVYTISKVVADTIYNEQALEEISKITREVFIFDSMVVYTIKEEQSLEPVFARVVGRGRSSMEDLTWGDISARKAIHHGETYLYQADLKPDEDRLDQGFFLAIPMILGGNITGALVFIRFGGPEYTDQQINLAEFVAIHVSQLFERQRLVDRVATLEAEKKLAQLQDDFIAMVSHELNTPLGFIKGYSTTLLRQDTEWDDKTRKEFLTIIDEEADKLAELIENLLDSSRLQSNTLRMKLKEYKLEDLASSATSQVEGRYQNLNITIQTHHPNAKVIADAKRLGQVIDNLVSNASKYASKSNVNIIFDADETNAYITVADNGPGIPVEHQANIFSRFYRVPENSAGVRGTGLGLFICAKIVQAHNGNIQVASSPQEGSKFSISFPISNSIPQEVN